MALGSEERNFLKQQSELVKRMQRRSYQDLNKVARKGQILFTGSSLMEQFPVNEIAMSMGVDKIIYNRGIGGTTTDEFLEHIDTVLLDLAPSKVFINIGTNDMNPRSDGEYWQDHLLKNYEKILTILKERLRETEVYMMAYYPVNPEAAGNPWMKQVFQYRTNERIRAASEGVKQLAQKHDAAFLDLNAGITDEKGNLKAEYTIEGMHMYANGYKPVLDALLPVLETL